MRILKIIRLQRRRLNSKIINNGDLNKQTANPCCLHYLLLVGSFYIAIGKWPDWQYLYLPVWQVFPFFDKVQIKDIHSDDDSHCAIYRIFN